MTKTIILFWSHGCGYCVEFKPIWDEFVKQIPVNSLKAIDVEASDVDKRTTVENELKIKFKPNGYPTVILVDENKNIKTFTDDRNVSNLNRFCGLEKTLTKGGRRKRKTKRRRKHQRTKNHRKMATKHR